MRVKTLSLLWASLFILSACSPGSDTSPINEDTDISIPVNEYKIAFLENDDVAKYASLELEEAFDDVLSEEVSSLDTKDQKIYLIKDSNLTNKYRISFEDKSIVVKSDTITGLICASKKIYEDISSNNNIVSNTLYQQNVEEEVRDLVKAKIMSYNVRTANDTLANGDTGSRAARAPRIAKAIMTWLPDTVGVQEANDDWISRLSSLLKPQYGYVGYGRNSNGTGESSGIYYNRDTVNVIEAYTKWLSDTPDVAGSHFSNYGGYNRIVTYAVFERISDGYRYLHVNTHLDLSKEPNALDARKIDELISPFKEYMPVFVTGDYNCSPEESYAGWAYDIMTNELGYSDPRFEVSDYIDINQYTFPQDGYSDNTNKKIIDFCLKANKGFYYTKYRVDLEPYSGDGVERPQLTSDHYPIYYEAIPYQPIKGFKKYKDEHLNVEIDNSFALHDHEYKLINSKSIYDNNITILAKNSEYAGGVINGAVNKTAYSSINISQEGGELNYKFNSDINGKADINLVMASSLNAMTGMQNLDDYISININDIPVDLHDINLRCSDVRQLYEWENLVLRDVDIVAGENNVVITTKNDTAPDQLLMEVFSHTSLTAIEVEHIDDPRDTLVNPHNVLRIEAENGKIIDPSGTIYADTEEKTLDEVNNPSGGKFVHGFEDSDVNNKRASITFIINASEAGKAVLSFGFGLDTSRWLSTMFDVQLNGISQAYYDDVLIPSYSFIQYYEWTTIPAIIMDLEEGQNAITLYYIGATKALKLDYIELDSEITIEEVKPNYSFFAANAATSCDGLTWNTTGAALPNDRLDETNGYYGSTKGKTFVYEISSEEEGMAVFYLYSARNKALTFNQQFSSFTVNDSADNVISFDNTIQYIGWYTYTENAFATLKLDKGVNVISFTIASGQSTNIAGIAFASASPIQLVASI